MNVKTFDSDNYKMGQRQQWNGVAAGWEKWWPTFEQMAQKVSKRLVHLADVQPNQNVLDIATGIGEPAVTMARQVGDDGKVVAVDQSPEMLAIARNRAGQLGLANIEFQESDAEAINFSENYFDAIVCRWGLMFLPNPGAGLSSIYRVLSPKGKFSTAIWDMPEKTPFINLALATAKKMFDIPPPLPGTPSPFGLAEGVLEDVMAKAGFTDVQTETMTVDFEFPSAGSYVRFMKDVAAPIQALLSKQSSEQQNKYWETLEIDAQKYATDDGSVRLPSISPCIVGRK